MTLTNELLEKLVTPKAGSLVSRLPNLAARKNAKLIAELKRAEEVKGMRA